MAQVGNQQAVNDLATTEADLNKRKAAIEELKTFFIKMKKEWSALNDRVIGHVVWAPPISFSTPPHGYTKDVCDIRLNKKKFLPNFKGNVIDLGSEIECGDFMIRMCPRDDAQSEFDYPEDRLLRLGAILSAAKMREPNSQDHKGVGEESGTRHHGHYSLCRARHRSSQYVGPRHHRYRTKDNAPLFPPFIYIYQTHRR
ncbi:hypothetical protein E4T56_gene15666 [Termitomyces sp. T112]|nr:hypothetical protein E4T56_gene15666 [Termitomyces sp. T112]